MEDRQLNEFLDNFTFQSIAWLYKGKKYFSDGIYTNPQTGKSCFYIDLWDKDNNSISTLLKYEGESVLDCFNTFTTSPIWDGKNFYEIKSEVTWIDW